MVKLKVCSRIIFLVIQLQMITITWCWWWQCVWSRYIYVRISMEQVVSTVKAGCSNWLQRLRFLDGWFPCNISRMSTISTGQWQYLISSWPNVILQCTESTFTIIDDAGWMSFKVRCTVEVGRMSRSMMTLQHDSLTFYSLYQMIKCRRSCDSSLEDRYQCWVENYVYVWLVKL